MTDVIWFMDVDGVLNFFPRGTPPADVRTGEATPFVAKPYEDAPMFPITWSKGILKRIADLHNDGVLKIVWLTTWGRGANYGLGEMLGLPFLDVVADPHDPEFVGMGWNNWWKAHAARAYIEKYNPSKIIWTDDDLIYHSSKVKDIEEMVSSLLIAPKDHRGLTHKDLDRIEAFARDRVVQTREDSVR